MRGYPLLDISSLGVLGYGLALEDSSAAVAVAAVVAVALAGWMDGLWMDDGWMMDGLVDFCSPPGDGERRGDGGSEQCKSENPKP